MSDYLCVQVLHNSKLRLVTIMENDGVARVFGP